MPLLSEFQVLKAKIFNNEHIPDLLEALSCRYIKTEQAGQLYTAMLPESFETSNKRSVQVKNCEGLYSNIRSRNISGDIFSIVGYIQFRLKTPEEVSANIYEIKSWICDALGYDEFFLSASDEIREAKVNWNWWLKKAKQYSKYDNIPPNEVLDENVLNQYIHSPHSLWVKDGISKKTQYYFEVMFDLQSNRIVFPIRNREGQLIGVKGRTVNPDWDELDIPKYMYLYKCYKSIELYNLHRALPYILEQKEVLVFEGAKSVMLAYEYGYKNAVAIEGDAISPVQAHTLKKLGIDIKIILCFDKDKDKEHIKEQSKYFNGWATYCVYDLKNIMKEKESPVDRKKVWDFLYSNCKIKIK